MFPPCTLQAYKEFLLEDGKTQDKISSLRRRVEEFASSFPYQDTRTDDHVTSADHSHCRNVIRCLQ